MNITLTKVYAAIVAIPVSAILLASAVSGGSGDNDSYDDSAPIVPQVEQSEGTTGSSVTEAEAYGTLGKYNPCIFIECEGE